jgi:hypothetical protein
MPWSKRISAWIPPADAPIPTIGKSTEWGLGKDEDSVDEMILAPGGFLMVIGGSFRALANRPGKSDLQASFLGHPRRVSFRLAR